MKVRGMDKDRDFVFGRSGIYLENSPEAVAQNVETRLALWTNQWFLDKTEGTQWLPRGVLGKQSLADTIIQSRISDTPGVNKIVEYESILNTQTRRLSVLAKIETDYGITGIEESL